MGEILLVGALDLSLPLKNPVLIFSIILFIILFAPILLNKIKVPHLIGLIIAGTIIGPYGLNLMVRDSSIVLFGTVGLLYIMFLSGLEIDIADFKKNIFKSFVFGLYTFMFPMALGAIGAVYLLGFTWTTAILLGVMFSSHTLITYPIVSKLGLARHSVISVAVGGTMVTNTLALLILAIIVGMTQGEINESFWINLSVSMVLFTLIVMIVFPIVGRWFFKNFSDNISQYIFVLGMVFLGAFMAEVAGIEGIIGAFMAGLALNKLVPHTSALMNRIEFVGNALFIPFFLIGVGMLIEFDAFVKDTETIIVAVYMTAIATFTKYIAAWLTQKTYGYSVDERRILFGLSNSQAAATLAAVLVGYNIIIGYSIDGQPIRLLNDAVLNGTIMMILVTCTIASFITQKGAKNIALEEATAGGGEIEDCEENILILINNSETTDGLINLSITVKSKKNNNGLFALNVINDNIPDELSEKRSAKLLEAAAISASATDNYIHKLMRKDFNIIHAISDVIKEYNISDLVMGIHHQTSLSDSFLGQLTEGLISKSNTTTLLYKATQPLATFKRHLLIIPENAEKEIGFPFWLIKVWNIIRNTGAQVVIHGSEETLAYIRDIQLNHPVDSIFKEFTNWKNFLTLSQDIREDDNLIIIMSRRDNVSYNKSMKKVPNYLNNELSTQSYIIIYPLQMGVSDDSGYDYLNPSMLEPFRGKLEKLDDIGKTITRLFIKK